MTMDQARGAPPAVRAPDGDGPKEGVRGRVLIIDDEPLVLEFMESVVSSGGFKVVALPDSAQALARLAEGARFDAMVSDIHMPGMDGIELLREVRRYDIDLPVVFVTGSPTVETAVRALDYGALKYLIKPMEPEELCAAVEKAVHLGRLAAIKRRALEARGLTEGIVADLAGTVASFDDALQSLWMAYQPIVRSSDLSVAGYEALMRSRHPVLSHPGLVISAAEQVGRILDVGRTVRDAVAAAMFDDDVELVFVNLHPRELLDPHLVDPSSPLSRVASRVVLEITERAALGVDPGIIGVVAALRSLGFRIAIDDLGAGYSSLSSFVVLEPEVVKLDLSLVRGVDASPLKHTIVHSMVTLCHEMGLLVVAEGVETREERDTLIALGCDLLQGFLFARPGPAFPEVAEQG